MKHAKTFTLLAAVMLFVAGPVYADTSGDSQQGASDEQWSETLESLQSYTAAQRDKALEAGKKTLDAMDRRIEKLEGWTKEKWDSLSAETRDERTEALNAMREQRQKVAEWYGGMKHSSSEAWDSVKQGFIESYNDLRKAYSNAAESFDSEPEQGTSE